ncbi:MAG: hypothetical protein ACYDC6_12255 [Acidobacteriaceae bacterium]
MIGVAAGLLIMVMLGALLSDAIDIHDTKLFPIDPEFLLIMLSSMLIFCVGIVAVVRSLFCFGLSLSELLPLGTSGLSFSSTKQREEFERERLLFSPPLSAISLRI